MVASTGKGRKRLNPINVDDREKELNGQAEVQDDDATRYKARSVAGTQRLAESKHLEMLSVPQVTIDKSEQLNEVHLSVDRRLRDKKKRQAEGATRRAENKLLEEKEWADVVAFKRRNKSVMTAV